MMKYYIEQICERCKCKFTVEPTNCMQDRNGLLQLNICCPVCLSYRYSHKTVIPIISDGAPKSSERSRITLSACPRCNVKQRRLQKSTAGGELRYRVKCIQCGLKTEYMRDADAARIAWNCLQVSDTI